MRVFLIIAFLGVTNQAENQEQQPESSLLNLRCAGSVAVWTATRNPDGSPQFKVEGVERSNRHMVTMLDDVNVVGVLASCELSPGQHAQRGIYGWHLEKGNGGGAKGKGEMTLHSAVEEGEDWSCVLFGNDEGDEDEAMLKLFYEESRTQPEVLSQRNEKGVWGQEDPEKNNLKSVCYLNLQ